MFEKIIFHIKNDLHVYQCLHLDFTFLKTVSQNLNSIFFLEHIFLLVM